MSSRIIGCVSTCLVLALSLGGCAAGGQQTEASVDSDYQLINGANVYEGSLSLEYRMGDPENGTPLGITLTDYALSKKVPDIIPEGRIDVDEKMSDNIGYSLDDAGGLSEGFEYVTISLEIKNPSDKRMLMDYGLGSIVSVMDESADPPMRASRRPVWHDHGIGREGRKDYLLGTIDPHETQDVTLAYIVSDKLLQSDEGTYLLLDGGVDKKAFRLDFDKSAD